MAKKIFFFLFTITTLFLFSAPAVEKGNEPSPKTENKILDQISALRDKHEWRQIFELLIYQQKQWTQKKFELCDSSCFTYVQLAYHVAFENPQKESIEAAHNIFFKTLDSLSELEQNRLVAKSISTVSRQFETGFFNMSITQAQKTLERISKWTFNDENDKEVLLKNKFQLMQHAGNALRIVGRTKEAIQILNNSLEMGQLVGPDLHFWTLLYLADSYIYDGNLDLAASCFANAKKISPKTNDPKLSYSWWQFFRANFYRAKKDLKEALKSIDISIHLARQRNDELTEAWALRSKGIILKQKLDFKSAVNLLNEANTKFQKPMQKYLLSNFVFLFEIASTQALLKDEKNWTQTLKKIEQSPSDHIMIYMPMLKAYKMLATDKTRAQEMLPKIAAQLGKHYPEYRDLEDLAKK